MTLDNAGRLRAFRHRWMALLLPIVLLIHGQALSQTPDDPQQVKAPEEDSSVRHLRFGAVAGLGLFNHNAMFSYDCGNFNGATVGGFSAALLVDIPAFDLPALDSSSIWYTPRLRLNNLTA